MHQQYLFSISTHKELDHNGSHCNQLLNHTENKFIILKELVQKCKIYSNDIIVHMCHQYKQWQVATT